ncbi:lipoprotein LipL36 [Leptospira interrogans]|uniref:lipoprotein LipL36 n=1 Tax=Leptospira interrogans TaxID=173 RepID=UPI0009E652BA|nr:lipoprotein LipL36 [Leptospira interrogans]
MRRNIMKIAAVAALTVALTACKGDDDDDDVVMLALLYLADQTSGNCVTIVKDDTAHGGAAGAGDGKPTYEATGATKPKAACSGTFNRVFIVGNAEAALSSVKASGQAVKAKLDNAGANCAARGTLIQTAMTNTNLVNVEQALAADAGNCTDLGPTGLNWLAIGSSSVSIDPNPEYFGKTVYVCTTEQAKERRLIQLTTQNFTTISGSVASDMATNLAFRQKRASTTASNYKWTADAATKGRLITVSELTSVGKAGAGIVAFTVALQGIGGDPNARACGKDLLSKETEEVQKIAFALHDPSISFNGAITGGLLDAMITTAQAQSATEVLFNSLTCKYGDFDEENAGNKSTAGTETNVKNIGTCPATYPKI